MVKSELYFSFPWTSIDCIYIVPYIYTHYHILLYTDASGHVRQGADLLIWDSVLCLKTLQHAVRGNQELNHRP